MGSCSFEPYLLKNGKFVHRGLGVVATSGSCVSHMDVSGNYYVNYCEMFARELVLLAKC